MAQIIDGKKISQQIKDEVKEEVSRLKEEGVEVTLAVIQVGSDPASSVYVGKRKHANTPVSAPLPTNFRKKPRKRNCFP